MPNASDKIWYVRKGIKKLGPFSNAEMRGLASSGKLVPEDMIWKEGLDGWAKASKLKGVFQVQPEIQEVSPPPIESEPETLSQNSNTSKGSILLITTVIGLIVAILGGGLIISAGQKKPSEQFNSTSSTNSKKNEIPTGNSAASIVATKETKKFNEKNVLEVKVLKKYQSSSYTYMDIEVANKSDNYLAYVEVGVSIYDKDGKYIANFGSVANNLRPDKSIVIKFIFDNVDYREIASWKMSIAKVHIDLQNGRLDVNGEKVFALKEIDN